MKYEHATKWASYYFNQQYFISENVCQFASETNHDQSYEFWRTWTGREHEWGRESGKIRKSARTLTLEITFSPRNAAILLQSGNYNVFFQFKIKCKRTSVTRKNRSSVSNSTIQCTNLPGNKCNNCGPI